MTYRHKEAVIKWRENNKEKYSQIKKECSKRYYQKNKKLLNEKRNEWGRNRTKRIKELQEENKKLRENIAWYEKEEDRLREENKKLKSTNDSLVLQLAEYKNKITDLKRDEEINFKHTKMIIEDRDNRVKKYKELEEKYEKE